MKQDTAQILDQQLDLLDQQARPEKWQREHENAMLCRDFEDLIALALETLGRIRKRSGSDPADTVWAYFRRWYAIGLQLEESVQWLEGRGYRLDRSDQFRFALNAAAMANDPERIAAACRRFEAGEGRSLDEIMNELSSQP